MALPAVIAGTVGRAAATGAASGGATGAMTGSATASRAIAQLGQFQGSMNQVSVSAQRATHWVGSLASRMTGHLARALTMFIDWVAAAAAPIERLVRVANPGIADAFGYAMNDAFGVVGRSLIPVMESFIRMARKVGDVMAGLEPVFRPAINAIAQLVDAIGQEFVAHIARSAPFFEALATVITRVAQATTVLVRVLGEALNRFGEFISRIYRTLGFTGESFDPKRSSFGAAARHPRFVQPREVANEGIRNALMSGVGQQKTPIENIDKNISEILRLIEKRWGQVDRARKSGVGAGQVIGEELGEREGAGKPNSAVSLGRWAAARRFS